MANEKIAIIVSDFNADLTYLMRDIAKEHVDFLGAKLGKIVHVPGAFDMPLAIKRLFEDKTLDGIVTLGAVLEGDTDHDQIVAQNAARKITDLSVEYGKPVAMGISGPGMTRADGVKRIESYAKRAVETCLKMIRNK